MKAVPGFSPGEEHRTIGAQPSVALYEVRSMEYRYSRNPIKLQWNRLAATSITTPVATAARTALLSTRTQ